MEIQLIIKKEERIMKKYFSNIRTLAALLMAGAAFTACSSDDNISEQPANPAGEKVYTLTVNATKGGDAQTRALNLDGEKLVASWETTDYIAVININKYYSSSGSLNPTNISADGNSATLTGTVTGVAEGDDLILTCHFHSISDFAKQNGRLNGDAVNSAEAYDQAEATVTVASIDDSGNITTTADASFTTQTAMIKFTLQDNAATPKKINATSLNVKATITLPAPLSTTITEDLFTFTIAPEAYTYNGNGILYYALPSAATLAGPIATKLKADPYKLTTITESDVVTLLASATITFTASDGVNTYTVDKTGYPFAAGSYYTSTLTMAPAPVVTDLSTIIADYTANDGETLTGTLASKVKISIADGATVTLAGVDINASGTFDYGYCAGITCLGDATIILKDGTTNSVLALDYGYPGIYVPVGHTLTIQGETLGTGILNASGRGSVAGAGIGAASESKATYRSCGNIVIAGGVINATGGSERAAGIGCGGSSNPGSATPSTCGTITITGGTITATGSKWAPGIGGGYDGDCGDITIANTVTRVTATKGAESYSSLFDCIGRGRDGACGTVKFGNQTMYNGSSWTTTPTSGSTYGGLNLTISQTTYANDTWTLTPLVP